MKWKIREIEIENPVVLAPMAGVTNAAFRVIAKKMGAGLIYAEMVSDNAVNYRNQKTLDMLYIDEREHPVTMQIFGSTKETFTRAAKYIDENCACDIIDINMGCPAPKITKNSAGARLLLEPEKIYEIVASVVDAVKKPVTVKIRTGWDHNHIYAVENALKIEAAGASAIAIHGRTRSDQYSGKSDWKLIKDVKDAIKTIPVIGNGDITTPAEFEHALATSGVDAIMIGRAALGNPWLFKKIIHYHETGKIIPDPTVSERVAQATVHMDHLIELKGERVAMMEMRSHMSWYIKGLPGATTVKREIVQMDTRAGMVQLLDKYESFLTLKSLMHR